MCASQYSPGDSEVLTGTMIGRTPLMTWDAKLKIVEELNVLPSALVLENDIEPLVPKEPVVTPPVELMFDINDIAPELVHETVALEALVLCETLIDWPIS